MTVEELRSKLAELQKAVDSIADKDEKTLKLLDIKLIQMKIDGMALSAINAALARIALPDIATMDKQIRAANDAVQAQQARIAAMNHVFGFLKGALGVPV